MPPTQPVLIVEDDAAIREALAEVLADEGYATLTAENGAEGLTCLEWVQPCLILLDLMMPVLDGFGFRDAQRAAPALADIPVIVLSAFPASIETLGRLDATAYLSKPINLQRLVEVVDRYC